MNAFNFLSGPIANALGWTLIHAVWQGFVLVLPVAIVLHLFQHKSGLLRYRVGVLTLFAQLLVSIGTFFWYYQPIIQTQPVTVARLTPSVLPVQWQAVARTLPWHQQIQQFLEAHLGHIVLIYLIGIILFGLRLVGGWLYLQRISKTATQPATQACAQLTGQLRATLAIRAVVQVRESARIAVPMVIGVLKPILLLPIGLATHLSTREIEAVLAHELAHIKRHDYAINLLQSVIDVLYFFHPALWWLSARVREEREHCCDDLAVQVCGGDGRILAQALARVEELRLSQLEPTPALAMAFASKRQHLLHRVRRVLGIPTRPFVSNGSLAGITLATILLMSVSVYAVHQQPETPKTQTKQPRTKSTQRFNGETIGKRIGYNLLDGRLTAIDVNGKRLPNAMVNQIQQQLDRVLTGQLNLDSVDQPNRDILLTIFEKSAGFEAGMAALGKGLDKIDYTNIVADAMQQVKGMNYDSIVNGAMQTVKDMNYQRVVDDAMASVSSAQFATDSTIEPSIIDVIRRQDSLMDLQDLNKGKAALLRAQAQTQEFAVEAIERKIERIERQKEMLDRQRLFETSKQQRVISESGFAESDSTRGVFMKRIETGEKAIQKVETEIEKLNQQLITVQTELEKAQKPLRQTETDLRKLRYFDYEAFASPNAPASVPHPVSAPHPAVAPTPNVRAVPVKPAVPIRPKAVPMPKP